MYDWKPHVQRRDRLRCVVEASCCEAYILCSEAGEFFVLRRTEDGREEETARGTYERAYWGAWEALAHQHQCQERRVAS